MHVGLRRRDAGWYAGVASQSAGRIKWESERFRVDTAKKKTGAGLGRLSRYVLWGAPQRARALSERETEVSGPLRVSVERFFDFGCWFAVPEA